MIQPASLPTLSLFLFIVRPPGTRRRRTRSRCATNLLMKPFTADTLAARIKELIPEGQRLMAGAEPERTPCASHPGTDAKSASRGPRAAPRARQVGPDRDWRQPGDRQRDLPAAGRRRRSGRSVGSAGVHAAVGLLSLSIALCFAEAGSRFESTGGPYLPARAAFGRFVGFEVGWMMWFARVTSHASVVNGLTLALAFYWPALAAGMPRAATITALTAGADVDQRARHQAVVVGRQRADDRQAAAAGDLHHRRHLVHRSVALLDHAGRSAASRSRPRRSC